MTNTNGSVLEFEETALGSCVLVSNNIKACPHAVNDLCGLRYTVVHFFQTEMLSYQRRKRLFYVLVKLFVS
jgi:hypothetical protein